MANIKEIAKLAGVSVKTVTRAYKRDAVISPETRERILKIAKENGYRPNRAAGRLAAKTIVIGICYAGTTESFNRELAAGIADAAKKLENSRIRLIPRYVSYLSDEASYISVLDEFADSGVDGDNHDVLRYIGQNYSAVRRASRKKDPDCASQQRKPRAVRFFGDEQYRDDRKNGGGAYFCDSAGQKLRGVYRRAPQPQARGDRRTFFLRRGEERTFAIRGVRP